MAAENPAGHGSSTSRGDTSGIAGGHTGVPGLADWSEGSPRRGDGRGLGRSHWGRCADLRPASRLSTVGRPRIVDGCCTPSRRRSGQTPAGSASRPCSVPCRPTSQALGEHSESRPTRPLHWPFGASTPVDQQRKARQHQQRADAHSARPATPLAVLGRGRTLAQRGLLSPPADSVDLRSPSPPLRTCALYREPVFSSASFAASSVPCAPAGTGLIRAWAGL
jgi:hypothetical protein